MSTTPAPAPAPPPTSRRRPPRCSPGGRARQPRRVHAVHPLLGAVEDRIIEAFRHGGGVPYSAYPDSRRSWPRIQPDRLPALLEQILPLAVGLTDRLDEGFDVADLGCGSGRALDLMAATFPNSGFNGYDLSEAGIAVGAPRRRDVAWTTFASRTRPHSPTSPSATTSSAPSTPSTTKATRLPCSPTSIGRSGPAASTSCRTSPAPATSTTTSTTCSGRSCTPSPACIA